MERDCTTSPALLISQPPEVAPGAVPRVVGVIPVLDEAGTVESVVREVFATGAVQELIAVDDGSKDGTRETLGRLQREFPGLEVLERHERGLGTALLAGFAHALDAHRFDRLVVLDADRSHDPSLIPTLLAVPADLVVGSRYTEGGAIHEWSRRRRIISLSANLAARHLMALPVRDVTSGYRVYRRDLVETIVREAACGGYEFQAEAVWLASSHGYAVAEVPITFVERKAGFSKLATLGEAWKFVSFVARTSAARRPAFASRAPRGRP